MANFFNDLFKNPYPVDEEVADPGYSMDPVTAQHIVSKLPDIQKRRRRVARLRAEQARYLEDAQSNPDVGHVSQGSWGGGRFRAIGSYIPHYDELARQGIGGIGEMMTNRQADREEENLDVLRNPEIIGATEQLGADDRAAGPMPNVDIAGMPDEQVQRVRTTVAHMTSLGLPQSSIDAYVASEKAQLEQDQLPSDQQAGDMEPLPSETIDTTDPNAAPAPPAVSPVEPTPPTAPPAVPPVDPTTQAMGAALQVPQEQSSGMIDVPPEGAAPVEPAAAPAAPPAQLPATDQTLRAYLGMLGAGDLGIDLKNVNKAAHVVSKEKNDETGMTDLIMSDGSIQSTSIPYTSHQKYDTDKDGYLVYTPDSGPNKGKAQRVIGQDGQPVRSLTPGEKKDQEVRAEVEARNATAGMAADTAATLATGEETAKSDVQRASDAADKVPQMELDIEKLDQSAELLLKDPYLDEMVGKGVWARISNTGELGATIAKTWEAGSPQADTLRRIANMKAQVFMPAFNTLKGGGQITVAEGNKAQQAMSDMDQSQTPEEFRAAVRRFRDAYKAGLQKMREVAAGHYSTRAIRERLNGGTPAPAPAPAPAAGDWNIEEVP